MLTGESVMGWPLRVWAPTGWLLQAQPRRVKIYLAVDDGCQPSCIACQTLLGACILNISCLLCMFYSRFSPLEIFMNVFCSRRSLWSLPLPGADSLVGVFVLFPLHPVLGIKLLPGSHTFGNLQGALLGLAGPAPLWVEPLLSVGTLCPMEPRLPVVCSERLHCWEYVAPGMVS